MVYWGEQCSGVREPGSFDPAATDTVPVRHWTATNLSDVHFSERFG